MTCVFVTGANGFIGKNLVKKLLEDGHTVYAQVRSIQVAQQQYKHERLTYIKADFVETADVERLYTELTNKGIEVGYYLIHSMSDRTSDFDALEQEVAHKYVSLSERLNFQQTIYLSGIINDEARLSPHLRSRYAVEKILAISSVPYTVLRASIIIGAGSASFEIIRDLVEKLPVMVAPKWVKNTCQPIALQDVLYYLIQVISSKDCYNKTFDIGGKDVLSFYDVLLQYAEVRGLKRYIITVPVLTPKLSSYWLVLVTSVPFSLASYLVESMKCNTVCNDHSIDTIFPHNCLSYKDAIRMCIKDMNDQTDYSTWIDAWHENAVDDQLASRIYVPTTECLIDKQRVEIADSIEQCTKRIWAIGGQTGWYAYDWAWKIRGLFDQLIGGIGLNRGRRHPHEIQVGDTIDFWRVLIAEKETAHLLLYAIMKVPGNAWLEFTIDKSTNIPVLIQRAIFQPSGVFGKLYWYLLYPIHKLIFKRMAERIAGR